MGETREAAALAVDFWDAQVQTLLKAGYFAFVILGGAHDLWDSIAKLSGGSCEYLVVRTEGYRRFGLATST